MKRHSNISNFELHATKNKQLAKQSSKETELMNGGVKPIQVSESAKRNAEILKIYFLDYYVEFLSYIEERAKRTAKAKIAAGQSNSPSTLLDQHFNNERLILRERRIRLKVADFDILRQIGQGGYGEVYLARKQDTREICALKKMSKCHLQRLGEIRHILTERQVLATADSPWLVKLLYAFQDTQHVYFAMEYVAGGDFRTLLNASGILKEKNARFYFAEMCNAVFELHRLGFIHRDLKPENFLLDSEGHVKLTDFGLTGGSLSKEMIEKMKRKLQSIKDKEFDNYSTLERLNTYQTYKLESRVFTLVGSPDYMAPEILTQKGVGYDKAVDYWSLGCILFEISCGYPPFTSSNPEKVWANLYNWEKVLKRPFYTGDEAVYNLPDITWDLISKLVCRRDIRLWQEDDLKNQKYFEGIEFTKLRESGMYTVPLVPKLSSEIDARYFDDFNDPKDMALYGEVQKRQQECSKQTNNVSLIQSQFVGFTFKHDIRNK